MYFSFLGHHRSLSRTVTASEALRHPILVRTSPLTPPSCFIVPKTLGGGLLDYHQGQSAQRGRESGINSHYVTVDVFFFPRPPPFTVSNGDGLGTLRQPILVRTSPQIRGHHRPLSRTVTATEAIRQSTAIRYSPFGGGFTVVWGRQPPLSVFVFPPHLVCAAAGAALFGRTGFACAEPHRDIHCACRS